MKKICWKGRAFKALSYGALARAGRNFSGSITIFHRGGGSKKLLRRIDFERKNIARGLIERIEYDPNRTARIALVRWSNIELDNLNEFTQAWNSAFRPKKAVGSFKLKTLFSRDDRFEPDVAYSQIEQYLLYAGRPTIQRCVSEASMPTACSLRPAPSSRLPKNPPKGPRSPYGVLCPPLGPRRGVGVLREEGVAPSGVQSRTEGPSHRPSIGATIGAYRVLGDVNAPPFGPRSPKGVLREGKRACLGPQGGVLARIPSLGFRVPRASFIEKPISASGPSDLPFGGKGPTRVLRQAFSYILACDKLKPGDEIFNIGTRRLFETNGTILLEDPSLESSALTQSPSLQVQDGKLNMKHVKTLAQRRQGTDRFLLSDGLEEKADSLTGFSPAPGSQAIAVEHLYQKNGITLPLWLVPLGSVIHNIELYPGAGGKFARAAGTFAQLVQKASSDPGGSSSKASLCSIRLPSGQHQLLDVRCRATIGIVSNIENNTRTLKKAGQSRWLGLRPVVRGVAMNPIDHPHGGGEGRTKGGRPSVSPWGKSAKGQRKGSAAKRPERLRCDKGASPEMLLCRT